MPLPDAAAADARWLAPPVADMRVATPVAVVLSSDPAAAAITAAAGYYGGGGPIYDSCSGYGDGYGGCPGYGVPIIGAVIDGVFGGYGGY